MAKPKFLQITKSWPIIVLFLISILLAFLNYQPNTWLTGWDNLHPEFSFNENIKRSLDTLWQEYQGPGLLGGMAHATDLPRQLILWGLSIFLPIPFLRYFWTFLMLVIGPLGAYFLSYHTLLNKYGGLTRRLAAFFTGLFYLLNLSTIQTFFTPFEAFTSFYGFLPWLLHAVTTQLHQPSKKNLLLLITIFLLSAPSFYIQTLFLVFLISLVPIYLHYLIKYSFSSNSLSTALLSFITLIITQTYWFLPVAYFSLTSSSTTINSTQNLVATPEIIARNREFGTPDNLALLKGFWFKYSDLNSNNQFHLLLSSWGNHFSNPAISIIGYFFFLIILVGILYSFKHRLSHTLPFLAIFIISLFFLVNLNPPTGWLYAFLQKNFTLFYQSFRSVYTKWSIPASLSFSLFFGVGVVFLLNLFKFFHHRLTITFTTFTLLFAFLSLSGPAFSGHLIYPAMRQSLPSPYLDLFNYMNTQDSNTRIANFPQNTFWGWQFYNWGYRGSGFLWYGLKQPILDRAFDVWSPYSDQYYSDIKVALYSQDRSLFNHLLEKYSINWILIDNSIINPGTDDNTSLYLNQLKQLLKANPDIQLSKSFDFLDLYHVDLQTQPVNFLSSTLLPASPTTPPSTNPPIHTDTPNSNHSPLKESKNCNPLTSGPHTRQVDTDSLTYTSKDANGCDHFLYPSLQLNRPYQVKITHKNTSGLPFLYCLEPYPAKTCLLFGYLPSSPDWTTTTLTLPALKSTDYGLTLHLFNQSLGNIFTQNSWKQIQISPLPLSKPDLTLPSPQLNITTSSHPTYSLYTASITIDQPYATLVLNQGYDTGWKAYLIDSSTSHQPTWLLYLKSLMLVPLPENLHQQSNTWANSWTLPQGNHQLLIVYLPQHLQFFGFSLLTLLPFLFLIHHRK